MKDDARAAFVAKVGETFATAMKLKRVMLKRGLAAAKTPCPRCGGWLQGRLAGPRKHLHMWCEAVDCDMRAIE